MSKALKFGLKEESNIEFSESDVQEVLLEYVRKNHPQIENMDMEKAEFWFRNGPDGEKTRILQIPRFPHL